MTSFSSRYLIRRGVLEKKRFLPEQREAVFVQTHGRALGPEEVLGELVGDEAHGETVAVPGAASLGRTQAHSKLRAVLLTTQLELT